MEEKAIKQVNKAAPNEDTLTSIQINKCDTDEEDALINACINSQSGLQLPQSTGGPIKVKQTSNSRIHSRQNSTERNYNVQYKIKSNVQRKVVSKSTVKDGGIVVANTIKFDNRKATIDNQNQQQ